MTPTNVDLYVARTCEPTVHRWTWKSACTDMTIAFEYGQGAMQLPSPAPPPPCPLRKVISKSRSRYITGYRRLTQEERYHAEAPAPPQSWAAYFPASATQPAPSSPSMNSASMKQPAPLPPPVQMSMILAPCCPHSCRTNEVVTPTACRFDPSIFEVILDRPGRPNVSLG
jgi:hypothetical protein